MSRQAQESRWGRGLPASALLLACLAHAPLAAQTPVNPKPPSEMALCGAAQKQAYSELAQQHETELRHHAMHPVPVARLKGMGATLAALRTATARNPRNPAECEKTTQVLAEAREQLERIAGSPAQLADCLATNRQVHAAVQASLLGLQSGGPVAPPTIEAAAARLDRLRATVSRDAIALVDCRALATELADAQAQVQRLLPPPSPPLSPPRPLAATALPAAVSAPDPAACREAQARSYNDLAQAYARLVGTGSVPVEWMAPLQALSERLRLLHASIADTAAPGWDCEAVARALAKERDELAAMSRR
ncbi:MAG: hypothetical protein Q7U73_20170 [Rubrivivax sp.]|nr:hypothetical protein [Rubrivivax sp.]